MPTALPIAIDRFLREHPMPETLFGRRAASDPRLIGDIRRGRRVGEPLRRRIEAFIAGWEA